MVKCATASGEYPGFIYPYTATGADGTCDTSDDIVMITAITQYQVDSANVPTLVVAEEFTRLKSHPRQKFHETFSTFTDIPDIQIRDADGTPLEFTLPLRCNEVFYCDEGKGCKNLPTSGSFSRPQLTCVPQ